ncbi:MAG: hypothetical protein AAF604_15310 [Acidobacteriota bacterium]
MKKRYAMTCLVGLLMLGFAVLPAMADKLACEKVPYQVNPDAAQDRMDSPTNFLSCPAGRYALCYYSGADPLPCTTDGDRADCQCQVFEAQDDAPMYVEIEGILNLCVYKETVEQCGEDGSGCRNVCNDDPKAPQCRGLDLPDDPPVAKVCEYIRRGTFHPESEITSTFSFATVLDPASDEEFEIGCNDRYGHYAGCMTAPCGQLETAENGKPYVSCSCPLWPATSLADYQFGRACGDSTTGNCALKYGQVWSAAYNPAGCPTTP